MKILLSLFYLAMNSAKKNELSQEPLNLDSNKRDYLKGFDTRHDVEKEPSINEIIELREKHTLLMKLTNDKVHILEKEKLAKEYLEEQLTMAPNLLAAYLMEDWEFEI